MTQTTTRDDPDVEKGDDVAERTVPPMRFWLLSVLIGLVAGIGAIVFRALIALVHNVLFLGTFSITYDANAHTPASPWGPLIILVPIVGAIGVAFLVKNFAPEAKGHGVPEVMDAIYYQKGAIRPIVAIVKSLASAISIGSGGSVGREGPIIQIGASFGSTVAQYLRVSIWQRITLIAAGAGGGIAATFNTPVGGVLFAVEIVMHEVSARTLIPVVISTVTATYVGRLAFGQHPSFVIPALQTPTFHLTNPLVLLAYVGLGVLAGGASALFIKSIYDFEDFFEQWVPGNYYVRHVLGMSIVGIMMYVMLQRYGTYFIQGVGYATIQDILSGAQYGIYLLLLLAGLKLLATSLTLGSGASGGVFSPALFIGATVGGAYGIVLQHLVPSLPISPPAFALAGMAGLVGGSTGAAMAAIVMIFEMTLDYNVIIPMTITVALSYGVRRLLSTQSIYTLKLTRRGHYMPDALQTDLHFQRRANEIMNADFWTVPAALTLGEAVQQLFSGDVQAAGFLVEKEKRLAGIVTREDLFAALERGDRGMPVGDIANHGYLLASEDTSVLELFARIRDNDIGFVLVVPNGSLESVDAIEGVITKEHLADYVAEAADYFSD